MEIDSDESVDLMGPVERLRPVTNRHCEYIARNCADPSNSSHTIPSQPVRQTSSVHQNGMI